jgi:hypothetical protein
MILARRIAHPLLLVLLTSVLVMAAPVPAESALNQGYLRLDSQPGDFIGQGRPYTFWDQYRDNFAWRYNAGLLQVYLATAETSDNWHLYFEAPEGRQLVPGNYFWATRQPFQSPTVSGLDVGGGSRGCNDSFGTFQVYVADYAPDGTLSRFAATFVQHCEWSQFPLRGEIRLGGAEMPSPLPELPLVPEYPDEDATPAFITQRNDLTAREIRYSARELDAFTWRFHERSVQVGVHNKYGEKYRYVFGAPDGAQLRPGQYLRATRWPFNEPGVPGISISGNGAGCNEASGNFEVIVADYSPDGALDRFEATFDFHCEHTAFADRGHVRLGFGPEPPPQPVHEAVPAHLVVRGDPGDPVTKGKVYSLSTSNGDHLTPWTDGNRVHIGVANADLDEWWVADFSAPKGQRLEPGIYTNAVEYDGAALEVPTMLVELESADCTPLGGIFEILEVDYDEFNVVSRFDARFEQHCDYRTPALRGQVRYGIAEAPPTPPVAPTPAATVSITGSGKDRHFRAPADDIRWGSPHGTTFTEVGPKLDLDINPDGNDRLEFVFEAPPGEKLTARTYPETGFSALNGRAGFKIVGGGLFCWEPAGSFTVHDIEYSEYGGIGRVNASFRMSCPADAWTIEGRVSLGYDQPDTGIGRSGTVARKGSARISGTLSCKKDGPATVTGRVVQGPVSASFAAPALCSGGSAAWRTVLVPDQGAFRPGGATVSAGAGMNGSAGPALETTKTLRLTPKPR